MDRHVQLLSLLILIGLMTFAVSVYSIGIDADADDAGNQIELAFTDEYKYIDIGQSVDLEYTCNMSGDYTVAWSSGDESIATVEGGEVKGVDDGVTDITLTVTTDETTHSVVCHVVVGTIYVSWGKTTTKNSTVFSLNQGYIDGVRHLSNSISIGPFFKYDVTSSNLSGLVDGKPVYLGGTNDKQSDADVIDILGIRSLSPTDDSGVSDLSSVKALFIYYPVEDGVVFDIEIAAFSSLTNLNKITIFSIFDRNEPANAGGKCVIESISAVSKVSSAYTGYSGGYYDYKDTTTYIYRPGDVKLDFAGFIVNDNTLLIGIKMRGADGSYLSRCWSDHLDTTGSVVIQRGSSIESNNDEFGITWEKGSELCVYPWGVELSYTFDNVQPEKYPKYIYANGPIDDQTIAKLKSDIKDKTGYDVTVYTDEAKRNEFVSGSYETELYLDCKFPVYSISYELDGGTNADSNPSSIKYGETVSFADPTKDDSLFFGWHLDEALTQKVTELNGSEITGDITLYAGWYPEVKDGAYRVIFYSGGHDVDNIVSVQYTSSDGTVNLPGDPSRGGLDFNCWIMKNSDNEDVQVTGSTKFIAVTDVDATFYLHEGIVDAAFVGGNGGSQDISRYMLYADGTAVCIACDGSNGEPKYSYIIYDENSLAQKYKYRMVSETDLSSAEFYWTIVGLGDGVTNYWYWTGGTASSSSTVTILCVPATVKNFDVGGMSLDADNINLKDIRFYGKDSRSPAMTLVVDKTLTASASLTISPVSYSFEDKLFRFKVIWGSGNDGTYVPAVNGSPLDSEFGVYSIVLSAATTTLGVVEATGIPIGDSTHGTGKYIISNSQAVLVGIESSASAFTIPYGITKNDEGSYAAVYEATSGALTIHIGSGGAIGINDGLEISSLIFTKVCDISYGALSGLSLNSISIGDTTVSSQVPIYPVSFGSGYIYFDTSDDSKRICDSYGILYGNDGYCVSLASSCSLYDYDSYQVPDGKIVLISNYEYGRIKVVNEGRTYTDVIWPGSSTVTFSFETGSFVEVTGWTVDGKWDADNNNYFLDSSKRNLTVNDVSGIGSISVSSTKVSQSSSLENTIDIPLVTTPSETVLSWTFGGDIDTSMSQWTGMASTPLIIGDYVYTRVNDSIFKVNVYTGLAESRVESVKFTGSYYHYLGYLGGGLIVDYLSKNVLDTDLSIIGTIDVTRSSNAVYNPEDGYGYVMKSGTLSKYDVSDITSHLTASKVLEPVWTVTGLMGAWSNWGGVTTPVFLDDSIYYVSVDDNGLYIQAVSGLSAATSDSISTSVLNLRAEGNVLSDGTYNVDDGWLTTNGDNMLYITVYNTGLFGDKLSGSGGAVVSIQIPSDGDISKAATARTVTGAGTAHSAFVVYGGVGFVNAGSSLIAYKISDDGAIDYAIDSIKTEFSHGSIVLDTSRYSSGKLDIYLIAYGDGQLYDIVYDMSEGKLSKLMVSSGTGLSKANGSQAIRVTSGGQAIWYNDDGQLSCITFKETNRYYAVVTDGSEIVWIEETGADASTALQKNNLLDVTSSGYVAASLYENESKSIGTLFYVDNYGAEGPSRGDVGNYVWTSLDSIGSKDQFHVYAIVLNSSAAPEDGSNWADFSGAVHTFSKSVIDESIVSDRLAADGVLMVAIADSTNGKIVSDPMSGTSGTQVTLTVTPDSGYQLKSLTVGGTDVTSKVSSGKYSFALTQNTAVSAVFEAVPSGTQMYSLNCSSSVSGANTVLNVTVSRSTGNEDISDARFLIIAKYSGSIVINIYSVISLSEGSASEKVIASTSGLQSITVELVSGIPSGDIQAYGYCTFNAGS